MHKKFSVHPVIKAIVIFVVLFIHLSSEAQKNIPSKDTVIDTSTLATKKKIVNQKDFWDIVNHIIYHHPVPRNDTAALKAGVVHSSVLPSMQYAPATGFVFTASSNAAFYTSDSANANISSVLTSVNYTTKKQLFIPIEGNLWSKGNKYNLLTDWHFEKFPQTTYGLGGYTTLADGNDIDYNYIRLYQTLLKTIAPDLYIGVGYDFDRYWNISEQDTTGHSGFDKYGFSPVAQSSGVTLSILYDARRNSINPLPGYYANIVLRNNFTFLGSDANWQSLLIDARKYFHFPNHSSNTLAFWTYDWFTLSGKPPYLNLVSTASDTYLNMGRGYVQGRFRGQDLLYLESEYRFKISRNGLLGGVTFMNVQSYTEPTSHQFETLLPGCGLGLRFKLNKFSNTNIAFDYGWGLNGSSGIFFNLGEVF